MPKKGKSLEDGGLATALGAAGGGSAITTFGGSGGSGYGTAAAYSGIGPSPTSAAGYGVTAGSASVSGSGGFGFPNAIIQGTPNSLTSTGNLLTSYGHSSAHGPSPSGPAATSASLPVVFPLRASPLPPPPPPGTIIVSAGHDASFSELFSHSSRVRDALRSQRLLQGYNSATHPSGLASTTIPDSQVTHTRLQSQHENPTLSPDSEPVYGYYGLNSEQHFQPTSGFEQSQAAKDVNCHHGHGSNLVSDAGSVTIPPLEEHVGNKDERGQNYHTTYPTPQTSIPVTPVHSTTQSHGHGFFSASPYVSYTGFTTPLTVPENQDHSYNAYSSLPVPPTYSPSIHNSQNNAINVRPTYNPIATTSGQLNSAPYTTTQVYPTVSYSGSYKSNIRPNFNGNTKYGANNHYKINSDGPSKYNLNGHLKYGPTGYSKYGPTSHSKYGPSGSTKYGPTGPSKYGPTGPSKYGHSGSSKYSPSGPSKYSPTGPSKYSTTGSLKYGPTGSLKYGPTGSLKYGPTGASKYVSTGPPKHSPTGPSKYGPTGPTKYVSTTQGKYSPNTHPKYIPHAHSNHANHVHTSNLNSGFNGNSIYGSNSNSHFGSNGNANYGSNGNHASYGSNGHHANYGSNGNLNFGSNDNPNHALKGHLNLVSNVNSNHASRGNTNVGHNVNPNNSLRGNLNLVSHANSNQALRGKLNLASNVNSNHAIKGNSNVDSNINSNQATRVNLNLESSVDFNHAPRGNLNHGSNVNSNHASKGTVSFGSGGNSNYVSNVNSNDAPSTVSDHANNINSNHDSNIKPHYASNVDANHAPNSNKNHVHDGNSNIVISSNPIHGSSGSYNYAPTGNTVLGPNSNLNHGMNDNSVHGLNDNSNYVYHGNQYKKSQYNSYGNRLPSQYETQSFTLADNPRHTPPHEYRSPHFYQVASNHHLPSSSSVITNPHDFTGQTEVIFKNDQKNPFVKCMKDDKSSLICVASTTVQENTGNSTKVFVGDAWAKTNHHGVIKDNGVKTVTGKIQVQPNVDYENEENTAEKGQHGDKSELSAETASGSAEEQAGEVPSISGEASTSIPEAANFETGDYSASMTTSNYGPTNSGETPEDRPIVSHQQTSADFSSSQDSRQVGPAVIDVEVGRDGEAARSEVKTGYHLPGHHNDQWTPINPARLEQDDSTQDQAGEKRETKIAHYNIRDYSADYYATPTPLRSSTVVLGINREYKPLQAFFGRQVHVETTPAPTQVSNLKYGDMLWSMVRSNVGSPEVNKPMRALPTTTIIGEGLKLSNGLGIDDHLNLVNGWGSHIDGTEDALARPEAFPEDAKPADISSEVHLTTTSPDGMALYYQNEAEETDTQKSIVKHDGEEAEDASADDEHAKEDYLSTTIPSTTTMRFRGRVKFSSHVQTTLSPDNEESGRRKKVASDETAEDIGGSVADDHAEEMVGDTTEGSHEEGEATDKPGALLDQLRKDVETTKDTLQNVLHSHSKKNGPKIISETGHILRGLAVAEQLEEQKW